MSTRCKVAWCTGVAAALMLAGTLSAQAFPTPLNPDRPPDSIYHDVDRHQWAWTALKELRQHGLFDEGLPGENYFNSKPTLTFYEFAINIMRVSDRVAELDTEKEGDHVPVVRPEDRVLLKRLIAAFEPELKDLGYFEKRSQDIPPFPDVPKTHWAYEAVTELKRMGILIGYPPERHDLATFQPVKSSKPKKAGGKR